MSEAQASGSLAFHSLLFLFCSFSSSLSSFCGTTVQELVYVCLRPSAAEWRHQSWMDLTAAGRKSDGVGLSSLSLSVCYVSVCYK